jgi:putative hemolysin
MSQSLTVELSDTAFAALEREAIIAKTSPAGVAAALLEQQYRHRWSAPSESERQAARQRFERHFGEIDLGHATGADNEAIDADLGREYASTHEGA